MGSIGTDSPSNIWKRLLQFAGSSNAGATSSLKVVTDGDGTNSALSLSQKHVQVNSNVDNTTAFSIKNAAGTSLLEADTTNMKITGGTAGMVLNTQLVGFGAGSKEAGWDGITADKHYFIPCGESGVAQINLISELEAGTANTSSFGDTAPQSTIAYTTESSSVANFPFYVPFNIVVDSVMCITGFNTAGSDSFKYHLMKYNIDTSTEANYGDLSSGVVVASTGVVAGLGYEQIYYTAMSVDASNASVSTGQILAATIAMDTVNSDVTARVQVRYHIV